MAKDKCEKHETQFPLVPAASQAAQPADLAPAPKPDETWPTDALLALVMALLAEAGVLARKTTALVFKAGHALSLLRPRFKSAGGWCKFQRDRNLPRTSVWEAIELYERATEQGHDEDDVSTMTWTEAKEYFEIAKPKADENDEGPVDAEPVVPDDDLACDDAAVAAFPLERHGEGNAVPAAPASPVAKANKTAKKDHGDLSPCEIDAATVFIKAVGSWDRAVYVIQAVQTVVGG